MKEIYFAGGCFWGVEAYMSGVEGVEDTEVGYANGHLPKPTYPDVCTGCTGYAETCRVVYDEYVISLEDLLDKFWSIIDPTITDQQGNDSGNQYRTGIYFTNPEDESVILASRDKEQLKYDKIIVTEIDSLTSFYPAEEYHQDYLQKNPDGYCRIDLEQ